MQVVLTRNKGSEQLTGAPALVMPTPSGLTSGSSDCWESEEWTDRIHGY